MGCALCTVAHMNMNDESNAYTPKHEDTLGEKSHHECDTRDMLNTEQCDIIDTSTHSHIQHTLTHTHTIRTSKNTRHFDADAK